MRALLLTALLILIFLRFCDTKHIQGFQIVYRQTEKGIHAPGLALSKSHVNNATRLKLAIANNEIDVAIERVAPGKDQRAITTAGCNKAGPGPAELTLEYMAVQLPRSHSFR